MSAPPLTAAALERQLFDRYGLLLTQQQLAAFLGRTPAGLRWSLANPADARTFALRDCARRVGRRLYYPASEVPLSSLVVSAARRCHAHHHPRGASP